jgi:hypothetical protein
VKAAIEEQSRYNAELFMRPRRNVMNLNGNQFLQRRNTDLPNIKVNDTVAAAAALLAELEASGNLTDASNVKRAWEVKNSKRATTYWLDQINDAGIMAFNPIKTSYRVRWLLSISHKYC